MKVNCDVSLSEKVQGIGLGCCVQNSEGFSFFSLSNYRDGITVIMAKMEAIAIGLAMAINLGTAEIVVESD